MKIVSLHIYGFGQLTDVKIDHLSELQVFYGENEAGKSTIMAFIHAILFGFPTKQQTELRYEPKQGSKYGGKIKIFQEDAGFVVIERVKGKAAAGDVSAFTENGEAVGEELVKNLLSNIDKGLFQAIFSFNLNGLQNIHQMKKEEIGKYLFSAGTLGTDRLALAEDDLQKELDARFKPGGKKPLINEKLQEIHHLNKELQTAAAKNQEYEKLVQQKDEFQQFMKEIQQDINNIHMEVNKLNEWKKIEPLVKEQKWIENERNVTGDFVFPARGIERYGNLKPLVQSYEAQIMSITERLSQLTSELETIKPNHTFLEKESEIVTAIEQYPLYQQLEIQEKQQEIKLHQCEEKLAEIREKLHLPLDEEEMLSINTSIYIKNDAEKLSRSGHKLEEVKQQLDHRFNEEKNALEMMEKDVHQIKAKILTEETRRELEAKVKEGPDQNQVENKLQLLRDKIELFKKASQQEKKTLANLKRQKQIQFFLFAVIMAGLIASGLILGQLLLLFLGIAGLIGMAIVFMFVLRQPGQKADPFAVQELLQEEKHLLHQLQTLDFSKMGELQEKLSVDNQYREQLKFLQIKLDQQQNQYDKVIKGFEAWELDLNAYKKECREMCRQLKIPESTSPSYLLESFQLIEQYKTVFREKQQLLEGLHASQNNKIGIYNQLILLRNQFLEEKNADIQKTVYLLRNQLKEEQEKNIQWREKEQKRSDMQADVQQAKKEHAHLNMELQQLLQEAMVENEKDFYATGEKAEKKEKLDQRLEDIEKQLHCSLLNPLERENCLYIQNCDELIEEKKNEEIRLKSRLKALQEQHASVKYEIQMIEEGGIYSELLHQLKEKKYELEEDAKEWAVFSIAQNILIQAVDQYKNIHLPRMLSKAEEYLSFLTEGNYCRIHLQPSGQGFLIERKDHTIFEANELSQATTEQVYVSIRFSLAATLYEKYRLPIIIDDSFVNFDAKRTQKVIELLKQFKRNQILFFTCHKHLAELFAKDDVLWVHNGAVQFSYKNIV